MKKPALLLLAIIYIFFIALGLPDALLGSAWTLIRTDLNVALGALGIMTFVIYLATTIATFNAPRLLRLLSTRWIVVVSITFTGFALIGISFVQDYWQMLLFALPLGIGAGAVDLSLNHYLTEHYEAHHMNFLHSFYGIGVTFGPSIMAMTLGMDSWRLGYIIVGIILLLIATLGFFTFPLWEQGHVTATEDEPIISTREALAIPGVLTSIVIFLLYVHIESLGGQWLASYFFAMYPITKAAAALATTTYYLTFTIGRLLSGFLTRFIKPMKLMQIGEVLIVLGILGLLIPHGVLPLYYVSIALVGLGAAPVYPNLMYMNKDHFKRAHLSKIMSLQMSVSYMGFGLLTPLAGLLFQVTTIAIYPYLIVIYGVAIIALTMLYRWQTSKATKESLE